MAGSLCLLALTHLSNSFLTPLPPSLPFLDRPGSDPLTALIAYSTYLRAADRRGRFLHDPDARAPSHTTTPPPATTTALASASPTAANANDGREETTGSRRRQRKAGQRSLVDWCKDRGLMGRALERLNQVRACVVAGETRKKGRGFGVGVL